jgi:hypothetical protein
MRSRAVLFALVTAVVLGGGALMAAPAVAAPRFYITVYNRTSNVDVTLIKAGTEVCWSNHDLEHPLDQKYVTPGTDFRYFTEKNNSSSCTNKGGSRGVEFRFREQGQSDWYVPQGSPGGYKITFNAGGASDSGFAFRDSLGTWVPRKDGKGLACWHTATYTDDKASNNNATGYASIYVYSGTHCNTAVRTEITGGSPPNTEEKANTPAVHASVFGPGSSGPRANDAANNGAIINLLSSVGVACPWYAYPNDTARCDAYNVGNDAKWSIDNVASDVRKFGVTKSVGANDPKSTVGSAQISIPPTGGSGTLSVNKTLETAEQTGTTTQNGGKVGLTLGFMQKATARLPFFGEGGVEFKQEISSEYSYSKTTTDLTTKTQSRTIAISTEALPGYTTLLDVFTAKREANYRYSADLDLGANGGYAPVATPASQALNQSPARRQPCLTYAIGGASARNSIMFTFRQLFDAGYSPKEPDLPEARRAFLLSSPFFQTSGSPCQGFPTGYAAQAGFKGDGVGTYENLGYDEKGEPVRVMTGCVYQTPYPPAAQATGLTSSRLEPPTAPPPDTASGPCQNVPVNGGTVSGETPGQLLDLRAQPSVNLVAPAGSDEILAPEAGGTIHTNNGALDIVYAGHGPTQIFGGSGENELYGGAGSDTLVGGHRGSNYLHAGSGQDVLRETNGFAEMFGGAGHDTFRGTNMTGVMAGGSGVNVMVGRGNLSRLLMEGGSGTNTYIVQGSGTPQIIEMPNSKTSTLFTDHTMTVPDYVRTAIATGSAHVTLRGGYGTGKLSANNAGDTLISGITPELLLGGPGRDTFVLNAFNDDVATGGRGADRYVFTGVPETATRPLALAYPRNRTAATITNFNPRKGDKLVLTVHAFGLAVMQLAHRFKLVSGPHPRPHGPGATLLLNTRTHILSFDADGSGPISDKVIAKLPHINTIKPTWLVFHA